MERTGSESEKSASVGKVPSVQSIGVEDSTKSALQDNIDQKGKNAYYFAHAHKANGPQWDGKVEPKLLGSVSVGEEKTKLASFEYNKSNITSYAFSDEGKKVKLYISLDGIGDKCKEEDISFEFTDQSFSLVINGFKNEPQCLSFGRLTAPIASATYRLKTDKVIVVLTKKESKEWHTINNKGTPDHELI